MSTKLVFNQNGILVSARLSFAKVVSQVTKAQKHIDWIKIGLDRDWIESRLDWKKDRIR